MRPERVIIAGAGIGGMALAAALQRLRVPVLVLERAARLGEVGAGLGILPNAVRALTAIGVARDLFRDAGPFRRFRICSQAGEELSEVDFERVFRRIGEEGYVLHRASLHAALSKCVDPATVRTGACVVAIEQSETGVRVRVEGDPAPVSGDLLVGADGLNSVVRAHVLADGPPRYAGETIFRGIVERELDPPDVCREVLGAGQRAAFYDLGSGRCYWWATSPVPAGTVVPDDQRSAYLQERFATWQFGLPELFARTPSRQILQNDIFDRKPARTWHRSRVVLLGDAAHPTTPNLGQGACLAIEDAVVLARAIARCDDHESAFSSYYRLRSRRTARITRLSHWWGRTGLWMAAPLVWTRDRAYRVMPRSWFELGMIDQYAYDAGSLDCVHQPLPSRRDS
jgi:2-polyprenyl-6-methoxyphenol hydroxylase-like FAD-dependent oxidoreductase